MVSTKHINTALKAPPEGSDDPEGTFTGYASVFGNVDSYGEVVVKGAFADALKAQSTYPVYWSHQMSDPMMNIGKTVDIREDDHGLYVKGQLDLETPMGAQVYRLIKDGRVNQMSFAFDVEDYAFASSEEKGEYVELRKLKLHEVSVVQVGANQATELLDVKDRVSHVRSSRALSKQAGDKLDQAHRLITEVLEEASKTNTLDTGSLEPPEDAEQDSADAGDDEPDNVKSYNPDAALADLYLTTLEGA